jgi:hypothetical protein
MQIAAITGIFWMIQKLIKHMLLHIGIVILKDIRLVGQLIPGIQAILRIRVKLYSTLPLIMDLI